MARAEVPQQLCGGLRIRQRGVGEGIVDLRNGECLLKLLHAEVLVRQCHRVHPQLRETVLRLGPLKLVSEKAALERRIVRHQCAPVQQRTEVRRDVAERGSIDDVGSGDLVDVTIRNVALRLDQCLSRSLYGEIRPEQHHADFYDAVVWHHTCCF